MTADAIKAGALLLFAALVQVSIASAIEVAEGHPDVVLVDPRLPDIEAGLALIAGMSRAWPSMRIVLTGFADTEGHAHLDGTPATYVSKGSSPEDFVSAIVVACAC